jgi:cobalt-precorrin 5A hydrolase
MECNQAVIVAGIGFSRDADAAEIAALVERCLAGRRAAILAVPEARAHLPQARTAAALLGATPKVVATDAIARAQPHCLTPPGRAGLAVAEGAALAAAGTAARLLGPRVAAARVTCALAEAATP